MSRLSQPNSKQWQELMIRNQKLALEVARLQEQNRILRRRVHSLAVGHLHLNKTTSDAASQTNEISSGEPMNNQNSQAHGNLEVVSHKKILIATSESRSPGKSTFVRVSQRRGSHVRRHSMRNIDFDLLEESSEFLKVEIDAQSDASEYYITTPTEHRIATPGKPSKSVRAPAAPLESVLSPCQQRVSGKLIKKVLSPYDVGSDRLSAHSPPRSGPEEAEFGEQPTTPSVHIGSPVGRTPRSVKKPVSYQEPSLRAKVRKGMKFFKFAG